MFIMFKSDTFPQVLPIELISHVREQPDSTNARVYLKKDSVSVGNNQSIVYLDADESVNDIFYRILTATKPSP